MTATVQSALRDKQDWTVDDLASLPEDLRYELIDGRLILPSPTPYHQVLGVDLVIALRVNCPAEYRPVPALSLEVDYRNEPRPDVVVVAKKHRHRSPVPVAGTLLAVEVVSPTSRTRDTIAKLKLYAAAGVGSYWIVDPNPREGIVLTEYVLGEGGAYEQVGVTDKVFTTEVPFQVTIDLPALTADRDAC